MVWQIATQTGWSVGYILRGVNYQTLLMMLSDAPRYVTEGKGNKRNSTSAEGFFRSLMKK